jgi:type I restriction enzyme R subunit
MPPAAANRYVHRLLIDGVTVEVRRDDGTFETLRVRIIDGLNPPANDFLAPSQV